MRVRRAWLSTVAVLLLGAAACSGDDPSLAMSDLQDSGDTCPVDLGEAVVDAGLTNDAADVEVEVTEGSGDGDLGDAAIDQFGGTYVECTVPVDGPTAVAPIDVGDAESAVLYVSAPDASPEQVRTVTEALLDSL